MAVRRLLHAEGLRYRVCLKVPGAPRRTIDIAFTKVKLAVFIDGCFWHGCPEHGETPASNRDWWISKIEKNQVRDAETTRLLEAAGWSVLRIWEHTSAGEAATSIRAAVTQRRNRWPTP
jgi:DNA mismatch endonuclease (patch repair protein)